MLQTSSAFGIGNNIGIAIAFEYSLLRLKKPTKLRAFPNPLALEHRAWIVPISNVFVMEQLYPIVGKK